MNPWDNVLFFLMFFSKHPWRGGGGVRYAAGPINQTLCSATLNNTAVLCSAAAHYRVPTIKYAHINGSPTGLEHFELWLHPLINFVLFYTLLLLCCMLFILWGVLNIGVPEFTTVESRPTCVLSCCLFDVIYLLYCLLLFAVFVAATGM
jgi:hypothetical protein